MEQFEVSKSRVMAIFAHPDDAEMAAGGTIANFAAQNSVIKILTIAIGDKGKGEAELREQESLNAARILGAELYESLGYPDGDFDNNLKLRHELTSRIRDFKPDTVICPDPTAVFFSHAYVNHRDHRETGWAVIDVVSSAVANPKYFPTDEAHHVPHLLCAGTQEPNCYVDIKEYVDIKIEAVLCHSSQIGGQEDQVAASVKETDREVFRYCSLVQDQV